MNLQTLSHIKWILLAFAISGSSLQAIAQIAFGGKPLSFSSQAVQLRATEADKLIVVRPNFNPDDIKAQNQWNAQDWSTKPYQVGRIIKADIDFARDAQRLVLPNGTEVYRITIEVKDAKASCLYYNDFYIPQNGGELFIYTPDKQTVLGKYTYQTHPAHGEFATEPLPGSTLILEYTRYRHAEMPSIKIDGVGHLISYALPNIGSEDKAPEDCLVNINCPEGDEWQSEKAGIVQMLMPVGRYGLGYCSGNLVNNTNEDFTPYILTAAHCISSKKEPDVNPYDYNRWIFTFHYEKPQCSNGAMALKSAKSMVGCSLKSYLPIVGQSDGALLQLNQMIPDSYRVYYNGWNRLNETPQSGVGIHHPKGDSKKLSVFNGNVSIQTWKGEKIEGGKDAHFHLFFDKGETLSGSSGSSLFNQEKLIVGTLTGGSPSAYCKDSRNLYGRLSFHWDAYKVEGDPLTQMATYLDPKGNGTATKLKGRWKDDNGYLRPLPNVKNLVVKLSEDEKTVHVFWDAVPREHLAESWQVTYVITRNGIELTKQEANELEEPISEALQNSNGAIIYTVRARYVYGGDLSSTDKERVALTLPAQAGINVAPKVSQVPITKQTITDKGIRLTWALPYNFQEVTLFGTVDSETTYDTVIIRSLKNSAGDIAKECTLASKYPSHLMHNNGEALYLHGIRFRPGKITLSNYRIFAETVHNRQPVSAETPFDIPKSAKQGDWVTAYFKTPIQIDPSHTLRAGIIVPNDKQEYMSYVKYSSSEERPYIDALIRIEDEFDFYSSIHQQLMKKEPNGFLAQSLLISPVRNRITEKDDASIQLTTKTPIPFPKVKEFIVKKDGNEVARVKVPLREWIDPNGKEGDKYTVEVVYATKEIPQSIEEVITDADTPKVYPSQIGSDNLLHITHPSEVEEICIYNTEGALILKKTTPTKTLQLEGLLPGSYIVWIQGKRGNYTQRILK